MVHRVHKAAVTSTNKRIIQRDLTARENLMQGLRFSFEQLSYCNTALSKLVEVGIFSDIYLKVPDSTKGDTTHRDNNPRAIKLHGRPWTLEQISKVQGLSPDLSNIQLGELNQVYGRNGAEEIQINNKVSYYDLVSYDVIRQMNELGDDITVRIKVKVGDVIEFKALEVDGRGFAKVVAIVLHCNSVFFVVSRLVRMPDKHPLLRLPQYRFTPIFSKQTTFIALHQVDHPRLVGRTHFVEVGGGIWLRNDWVFDVV